MKPVVLTAPRLSNELHLGNYLGAILPMVQLADKYDDTYQFNFFIADLHGITTPIDYKSVQARIFQYLRMFTAAGFPLDKPDIHIYRQSYVPAHSELAWILDCFTYMGEMRRMTQFKEKSEGQDNVSIGLFHYPVLMAADILLYGARYVPVGEDQQQHVEIARDIALRMNAKFKDKFPTGLFNPPLDRKAQLEFLNQEKALRIRDLLKPEKKMSKSDETGKGVIFLGDDLDTAAKKVMGATTDSEGCVRFDMQKQAGVSNLLQILAHLSEKPLDDIVKEYEGQAQYGPLKQAVAESVKTFLTEFQTKLTQVDDAAIMAKLKTSEAAMNIRANRTLLKVQQAVGLRPLK